VLITRALEGDLDAIKEIINRVEGRPGLPYYEEDDEPVTFTLKIPRPGPDG
jgi:hypothetical protein